MEYLTELLSSQSSLFYLMSVAFFMFFAGVIIGWGLTYIIMCDAVVYPTPESDKIILDESNAKGMAYHLGYVAGFKGSSEENPYDMDCDEWAYWYMGNKETKYKSDPSITMV